MAKVDGMKSTKLEPTQAGKVQGIVIAGIIILIFISLGYSLYHRFVIFPAQKEQMIEGLNDFQEQNNAIMEEKEREYEEDKQDAFDRFEEEKQANEDKLEQYDQENQESIEELQKQFDNIE